MPTISLVMIVKDEESVLARCLSSAAKLVDEIIIVDTGSTDSTKEIAESFNAKVYDYEWNQSFAEARNYALEQSSSDWNLILDADEFIANDCGESIRHFIQSRVAIGRVKILNKYKDKEGISFAQSYISRLFPQGLQYSGKIHEQIQSELPRIKIPVEVQHDGYYETNRSARNIPLLEQEIKSNPNDPYYYYQISKEYKGIDNHSLSYKYIKKSYSLLTGQELYAPNVVVDYLYAIIASGNLEEGQFIIEDLQNDLADFADFHFVSGLYYLDLIMSNPGQYANLLPRIEQSYMKCLEIGETDHYDSVLGTGSFSAQHNLAAFYEVTGNNDKALHYYRQAALHDYEPSLKRLQEMK